MRYTIFILSCFIVCASSYSQPRLDVRFVSAKSGLIVREKPSKDAKQITVLPCGGKVTVNEISKKQETVEQITAPWMKISYNTFDKKSTFFDGWVFGGFLTTGPVAGVHTITTGAFKDLIQGDYLHLVVELPDKSEKSFWVIGEYRGGEKCDIYDENLKGKKIRVISASRKIYVPEAAEYIDMDVVDAVQTFN